jgi:glycosyltransferase involved in cell wall biosynthesis
MKDKEVDTSTHFKIVVPLHNAGPYVKECIDSIKRQEYKNYECVIVDDASTDNSWEIIQKEISNDKNFTAIRNQKNVGALLNIVNGVKHLNPNKEDVIVNLDGDDLFSHKYVLNILNARYLETDCWLTYGSHEENRPGEIPQRSQFCKQPVPTEIIENNHFRQVQWMTSALRTFKFGLWDKIRQSDMQNSLGSYYEAAWDLAYMFPMLEMAAHKIEFIEDILYVYNIHESNDHHVPEKRQRQLMYEREIRSKNSYEPITSL